MNYYNGYTIYKKDRSDRSGGGVLLVIKTDYFQFIQEYSPDLDILQQLKVVSAEVTTIHNKKILFSSVSWPDPDNAPYSWMENLIFFLIMLVIHSKI